MILQGGTDIPFPDAVSLFCCLLRYSEQKVQHYKAQSQGQQVLYAYGKKWAQVFPCPGRQSRQKALYLGQTSLQQGTIPILLLPRLPSPLPHGNGVNRCSHTDLEVAVHHPEARTSSCSVSSLLSGSGCAHHRTPASSSRGVAGTGLGGLLEIGVRPYSLHNLNPASCRGRRRTGSALGNIWEGWS